METISIKINVSLETYKYLRSVQEILREKTGKKTSLADILLNFSLKGIELSHSTQKNCQSVQNKEQNA
jgi:hypothetical protein